MKLSFGSLSFAGWVALVAAHMPETAMHSEVRNNVRRKTSLDKPTHLIPNKTEENVEERLDPMTLNPVWDADTRQARIDSAAVANDKKDTQVEWQRAEDGTSGDRQNGQTMGRVQQPVQSQGGFERWEPNEVTEPRLRAQVQSQSELQRGGDNGVTEPRRRAQVQSQSELERWGNNASKGSRRGEHVQSQSDLERWGNSGRTEQRRRAQDTRESVATTDEDPQDYEEFSETYLIEEKEYPYSTAGRNDRLNPSSSKQVGYGSPSSPAKWLRWAQEIEQTTMTALSGGSRVLSLYVVFISVMVLVPFAWFSFAGQAAPLNKYYTATAVAFAAQLLATSLMDAVGLPEALVAAVALVNFVAILYYCWVTTESAACGIALDIYFGSILLALFFNLSSSFVTMKNQFVYWIIILALAYTLTYCYPLLPVDKQAMDGFKTSVISSYGFLSSVDVILALFGITGSFDFFSFFSVPSVFTYSTINCVYLLILMGCVAGGTYVNVLRDRKLKA